MPCLDMPLEQLKKYHGCNERPADFDVYWERALTEAREITPCCELRPAAIQSSFAECFDLYFTSIGGARIHAKYVRPKGKNNCPVLLMFHGYCGNCGDWYDKLAYAAQGFAIAALDCRGQAGQSQDVGGVTGNTQCGHIIRGLCDENPDKLLYRDIFIDTFLLAEVVATLPETSGDNIGVFGVSQGGALSLACAALSPRVSRVCCAYPFLSDYRRVWEMDLTKNAYKELSDYFRRFDPRHEHETEIFTRLGYIDVQHLASRIRGQVLMAVGLMDDVCPPSTHFAVYNQLICEKKMIVYPDFGHENLPGFVDSQFEFLCSNQ